MQWEALTFATVLLQILMTTSTLPPLEKTISSDITANKIDYRLPTNVKPIHYKITLDPLIEDPDPSTFNGKVIIRVKVIEETEHITLHYNNLTIHNVNITRASDETDLTVYHSHNPVTHFWVISLNTSDSEDAEQTFKANEEYLIVTNYSGHHQDDMYGFYRSSYKDQENKTV
jgi:hypothetical protein